jgi:hypothetical protein
MRRVSRELFGGEYKRRQKSVTIELTLRYGTERMDNRQKQGLEQV